MIRKKLALAGVVVSVCAAAGAAYAALPSRTVDPSTVGIGALAGATPVDVLSVDAFMRAINQAQGTNAVLEHIRLPSGYSTGWITSPGPKIVLVVGGELTLTDDRCSQTAYGDGAGFVTDLGEHRGVAGNDGADIYVLHLAPEGADVLRTPADPPICASH